MAQSLVLSGTLALGGTSETLSKTFSVDHLRQRELTLASGDVLTMTFDSTVEGTNMTFLFLRALLSADTTQHAEIKYSVLDADGADPPNGTAWRTVNGLMLNWENLTLSATYKLYVYNAGGASVALTVAVGLDG
jgi:hypothetical protein